MKFLTRKISLQVTAVLIIFFTELTSFSQDTSRVDKNLSKLYSGIIFGITKNSIITGNPDKLDGLSSTSSNSFHILYEMGYFFSNHAGITTGIGYETYRNEFSLDSYSDSFPSIDIDNEEYDRRVSASAIIEGQDISMINIPLSFIYRVTFLKRAGFFLSAGINLAFPIVKNYNSSGIYTFDGYYSSYNVLFHDLPEYGFSADAQSTTESSLDLAPYIIDATAGAGIQYSLSKKFQIALGVNYKRSLTDLSGPEATEMFQLSSDINQINSMVNGLKSLQIETIDLRISLRYYFR